MKNRKISRKFKNQNLSVDALWRNLTPWLFVVLFLGVLGLGRNAEAADRYWIGGTGSWSDTAHWSTSTGGAGGASEPGTSDRALFDANSGGGTCSLTAGVSINILNMNLTSGNTTKIDTTTNNYAFTTAGNFVISAEFIANGSTITVGGYLEIPTGTFTAGSSTITVAGNWDSSVGTFTYGTSTVNLTGTGNLKCAATTAKDFYILTMAATGKITTFQSRIDVVNICTLGGGTITGAYILFIYYMHATNPGLVLNNSTLNVTYVWYKAAAAGTMMVAGGTCSGSVLMLTDATVTGVTFKLANNLTFSAGSTGGFWFSTNSTTSFYTQNYNMTVGRMPFGDGGIINIYFGSSTITVGTGGFYSQAPCYIKLYFENAYIYCAGNFSLVSTTLDTSTGTSTVEFNGATNRTITTNNQTFDNIVINNTAVNDDVIISGNLNLNNNLTITDGELKLSTNNPNVNLAGNLSIANGGNWTKGTGTLTFNGTSQNASDANSTPKDLGAVATSGTTTVTLTSGLRVTTLNIVNGTTFSLGTSIVQLTITGSGTPLTVAGTFSRGTGDGSGVRYLSSANTNITALTTYGALQLQPSANNVTFTLGTASGQTITIYYGFTVPNSVYTGVIVDANTYDPTLSIGDPFSIGTANSSGTTTFLASDSATLTLTYQRWLINSGTTSSTGSFFTHNNGTVTFNPALYTFTVNNRNSSFYNLIKTGAAALQLLTNNLVVSGDLVISAGTIDLSTNGKTLTVSGNLTNTANITESSTGYVIKPATSCLLTNSLGTEAATITSAADIYVTLTDYDENKNGGSSETATGVTVSTTRDSEVLSLTETGSATGVFRNTAALPYQEYDGSATPNDGVLEGDSDATITVDYTDSEDNSDNAATDTATGQSFTSGFTVSATTPQVAGTDFTLTITAVNSAGATSSGYSGTVNLAVTYVSPTSGTKTLSTTSTSIFTSGVATVSLNYPDCGTIKITATDSSDSTKTGTSGNIVFLPASFTLASSKTSLSVNESFTLTITAKNSLGATAPNYQGLATLSINCVDPATSQSGSLSTSTLAASNWSSGIATLSGLTYNKYGTITITAKDPTNTAKTGTSAQLTFLPKDFEVTLVSPGSSRDFYYKGEPITATVKARDYNAATVSNYAGTVTLSGDKLDLPSSYTLTSAEGGSHIFSDISGNTKGATTLTATDSSHTSITGISSDITIKEGTIRVLDTSGDVGTLKVNLELIDSDGYDITNDNSTTFTVTLTEGTADNTASSTAKTSSVTFDGGAAEIEVTDQQAETVTVTPVSESYLNTLSGTVIFGGVGVPQFFGQGAHMIWWREIRSAEMGETRESK